MTKEEIVERLFEIAEATHPCDPYYIDDELIQAMNQYPNPIELVEPILALIGTNPTIDFGIPGELVRFVERFYKKGYEEMLFSSVRKNPTAHNILMVHRVYNDFNNPHHAEIKQLIKSIQDDNSVTDEVKNAIDGFSW